MFEIRRGATPLLTAATAVRRCCMISAERRILMTDNRPKAVIFVSTSEASKSCADASEFRRNSEIPSQQRTAKTGGAAMKKRSRSAVERIVETPPSSTDPQGSWTGKPMDEHDVPVQDADDL